MKYTLAELVVDENGIFEFKVFKEVVAPNGPPRLGYYGKQISGGMLEDQLKYLERLVDTRFEQIKTITKLLEEK